MKKTKCLFPEGKSTEGMVSVSQLQTYMACPAKWEYSYIENLTPRVERPYLTVGKLCHVAMQAAMTAAWNDQRRSDTDQRPIDCIEWMDAGVKALNEEFASYMAENPFSPQEELDMEVTRHVADTVFRQAFIEFQPWRYEVATVFDGKEEKPALELHFLVPCAGAKGLHGYIDAILKDGETGNTWCVDYKFRKSLSPDDEEAMNIQNAVYTYACKKMGIFTTGTMTWQHVNIPPADPMILKSGGVSRAKIKTTWDHYASFVEEHGDDPAKYKAEMQEKLADIEWYRATYEFRNDETVKNMWNKIVVPSAYAIKTARAQAEKGKKQKRHMYPWNCKMCQFKDLCQAELRNHDADYLRQTEYTTRGVDKNSIDTPKPDVV